MDFYARNGYLYGFPNLEKNTSNYKRWLIQIKAYSERRKPFFLVITCNFCEGELVRLALFSPVLVVRSRQQVLGTNLFPLAQPHQIWQSGIFGHSKHFCKKKSDSSYSQLALPMHCCTGQSFPKSGPKSQNIIKTMNIRFN